MRLRLSILVVDDDAPARRGLKQLLIDAPDIRTVGEAATIPEAVAALQSRDWDAVVVAAGTSGRNSVRVVRQLKAERRDVPIVVLGPHEEDPYAIRAVRAGASASLSITHAEETLVEILKSVAVGARSVSAPVASRLADEPADDQARPRHAALSDREFQVMRLLIAGKSTWDIARELSLQPKTVNIYRVRILRKIGATTYASLVQYAARHGLTD